MSAVIYTILKEFFVEIHGHSVKARIMSPINNENSFKFQISLYFKNKSDADPNEPASTFTSYANAERHLLSYLEAFQNTLDLGGEVAEGSKF
ncbi:hypothetical protein DU508_12515 [Pedobacter chinensis]|uniref:Uncharacterized protein n=1 Tax=Pedobacter chinensis TaxID=2282421 RepID=A0A369Q093_9SPHI|nr:hypothetical protein [Pedobacter chinensis]RDC56416.1 hypothetical protein DU508_12515 [Pedobacter chinensis]